MANQTSGKDGKGREMRCSFCGRSQNEVEQLLIGPGVNICNECIDMCHNMLYKDGENPPPPRAGASRRQQAQVMDRVSEAPGSIIPVLPKPTRETADFSTPFCLS